MVETIRLQLRIMCTISIRIWEYPVIFYLKIRKTRNGNFSFHLEGIISTLFRLLAIYSRNSEASLEIRRYSIGSNHPV